jgi:hypothetical protein
MVVTLVGWKVGQMDDSMAASKVESKDETLAGLKAALSVAMMGWKTADLSVVMTVVLKV